MKCMFSIFLMTCLFFTCCKDKSARHHIVEKSESESHTDFRKLRLLNHNNHPIVVIKIQKNNLGKYEWFGEKIGIDSPICEGLFSLVQRSQWIPVHLFNDDRVDLIPPVIDYQFYILDIGDSSASWNYEDDCGSLQGAVELIEWREDG